MESYRDSVRNAFKIILHVMENVKFTVKKYLISLDTYRYLSVFKIKNGTQL